MNEEKTTINKIYKTVGKSYKIVSALSLFVTSGGWHVPMVDMNYKVISTCDLSNLEYTDYWDVEEQPVNREIIMAIFDKEFRIE